MRYACFAALFALIVAVAACGCASGPAAPPAGGPAGPAPAPEPRTLRSGALFDTAKLLWYEYRRTAADGGRPGPTDVRFEHTTDTVNGVALKDDRVTMKIDMPDSVVVMDSYYDPLTGKRVGTRRKLTSSGALLTDQDIAAIDSLYRSGNIADAYSTGNWPLSDAGTEAVSIEGKSYTCTKYAVGDAGKHGTAWVAEGVPVPVKVEGTTGEGAATWELVGWG